MWRRREHHRELGGRGEPPDPIGAGIGNECQAFLAGQLAAYLTRRGRPVPSYAWLNQVVYASETELAAIAAGNPPTIQPVPWQRAVARLARTLLERSEESGCAVGELQRDLLLPLELELADNPDTAALDPAGVMRLALCRLFEFPTGSTLG